jgi:tRNA (guanosine-2'-O-)-methyltransferase
VHIIENKNQYRINPDVALGASKWLNLYSYNQKENNTLEAIRILRNKGYRIVATTPHTNDITLDDFDEEKSKFVLFFGTELQGLSKLMMDNADEYLKIPMYGFTESFNISVSAALTMHHLSEKIRKTKSVNWQLTDDEKDEIILDWLRTTIKHSDEIITQFYKNKK